MELTGLLLDGKVGLLACYWDNSECCLTEWLVGRNWLFGLMVELVSNSVIKTSDWERTIDWLWDGTDWLDRW